MFVDRNVPLVRPFWFNSIFFTFFFFIWVFSSVSEYQRSFLLHPLAISTLPPHVHVTIKRARGYNANRLIDPRNKVDRVIMS